MRRVRRRRRASVNNLRDRSPVPDDALPWPDWPHERMALNRLITVKSDSFSRCPPVRPASLERTLSQPAYPNKKGEAFGPPAEANGEINHSRALHSRSSRASLPVARARTPGRTRSQARRPADGRAATTGYSGRYPETASGAARLRPPREQPGRSRHGLRVVEGVQHGIPLSPTQSGELPPLATGSAPSTATSPSRVNVETSWPASSAAVTAWYPRNPVLPSTKSFTSFASPSVANPVRPQSTSWLVGELSARLQTEARTSLDTGARVVYSPCRVYAGGARTFVRLDFA